jgi:AhpD family alkylhydroperoxidase
MSERIYFPKAAPEIYQAIRGLNAVAEQGGLDKTLIELVRMRASQMNGCAFCLDMHGKDARGHGETEQRLYVLPAWRETPYFTPRERAALAWTERLTHLPPAAAPEDTSGVAYRALEDHFAPAEIASLTALIGVINLWNRIAIGLHWPMPRAA